MPGLPGENEDDLKLTTCKSDAYNIMFSYAGVHGCLLFKMGVID